METKRAGKHFEFGYPHFQGWVDYSFPNEKINYPLLFRRKKEKLGPLLIENLRRYIDKFGVRTSSPWPYLQKAEKGLVLHLGNGGRWIEVESMMGIYLINTHNLDSYIDRAAAFNIGADTLEHIDPEILAPRISVEKGDWIMRYPLPQGLDLIPEDHEYFNEKAITNLFELMKLDTNIQLTSTKDYQEIKNSQGTIRIEKGVCEGRNFEGWTIPKSSWVTAKVMGLCEKDK